MTGSVLGTTRCWAFLSASDAPTLYESLRERPADVTSRDAITITNYHSLLRSGTSRAILPEESGDGHTGNSSGRKWETRASGGRDLPIFGWCAPPYCAHRHQGTLFHFGIETGFLRPASDREWRLFGLGEEYPIAEWTNQGDHPAPLEREYGTQWNIACEIEGLAVCDGRAKPTRCACIFHIAVDHYTVIQARPFCQHFSFRATQALAVAGFR